MMEHERYPDLFNWVYGPVMQPGSSSHTASPCRLGLLAAGLLGEPVRDIHVTIDPAGSFAGAFGIMAEDNAMIAGALGLPPDDVRLFEAGSLARDRGVSVRFDFAAVCMAPVFADMALAGHQAVLSLDEALDTADRIGRALPSELLCTSKGGAAIAPSAIEKAAAFRKWFEESRKQGKIIPPGNLI